MGASSYPGMTQPFSMAHSTNMGSVGVRQDSMGKFVVEKKGDNFTYPAWSSKTLISLALLGTESTEH